MTYLTAKSDIPVTLIPEKEPFTHFYGKPQSRGKRKKRKLQFKINFKKYFREAEI